MGKRKTTEEFINELNIKFPNKYEVMEPYVNAKHKIKIKHIECGNIWEITPSNLLHGYSCPICNGGSQRTKESFNKIIQKLYPNEYTIIGDYKDARTKILVEHNKCGYKWEITPDNLKRGKGCPHCNSYKSKAVYEIEEFLINIKAIFQLEKSFNDLYGDINRLHFDICIYKDSTFNDFILIEYDGVQHKDTNSIYHHENLIKYDNKKTQYCLDNNLRLYRFTNKDNLEDIKDFIINYLKS